MITCYIGTYPPHSGIYQANFNPISGKLSSPTLFCPVKSSKYIFCEKDTIFTLFDGKTASGVAVYTKNGKLVDSLEFEKNTSCYLLKHNNYIYTTNYHTGTITKLQFIDNKLKVITQQIIKEKAGCHQVILLGNRLLVPCLLLDRLYILDNDLNIIEYLTLPPKSSPRHGVISKEHLYLVGELSDILYTFSIQNNHLTLINELSLLPQGLPPAKATAAIRLSTDGNTLMISTRNINNITMIDISNKIPKIIQDFSSLGDHPRDILNILNDHFLLVANMESGTVISLKLDKNKIIEKTSEITVFGAVSICVRED